MQRATGPYIPILIAVLGCATGGASVTSTWRAPEVRQLAFRRSVVTFVSTDAAMRRAVEDRTATLFPGSFPAHGTVPDLSLTSAAKAREQLRRKLFDGAVVVRVVDVRHEKADALGEQWASAHPSFLGYWDSSWASAREPAYGLTSEGAMVEVLIYSLTDDRLVWAGRAASVKPRPLQAFVNHSVDAVVGRLQATDMLH